MLAEFFCGICREVYASSEDIYRTRCGHVFHQQCVTDWIRGWSATCPDCRAICSSSDLMKIIFSSRSNEDLAKDNLESKSRLAQATKTFSEIQNMLEENEMNFAELQIQLDTVVAELTDLQLGLEQMQIISETLETELNSKNAENRLHQEDLMKAYEEMNKLNVLREKKTLNIDYTKELKTKDEMIEELNKKINEKSLELQKEMRNLSHNKLVVEKTELCQRMTRARARQQRASSARNVECDQPNTMEATDPNMMLKSLETQFKNCDLNGGVSGNTSSARDNNRDIGAIQKTPGVSRPARCFIKVESIRKPKNATHSGH